MLQIIAVVIVIPVNTVLEKKKLCGNTFFASYLAGILKELNLPIN